MAGATILGISPGTKYMGIALQRHGTLYEWKVKTNKGAWSEEKLIKVVNHIEHIVITHVVKHIACKVPHSKRCSSGLKKLIEEIKAIAEEYKLKLHIYSITDLKEYFKAGIKNKLSLASHILTKHPELTHIFLRERKNKNPYYLKVFEAVAAVTHYYNSVN